MRKIVLGFVLLIILAFPSYAFANGGPGEGYALLSGGNIQFKNTPDIFVEKEDLNIVLSPRTSVVTAVYTLKNAGPARDLSYIFPITQYVYDEYSEGKVEWIAFYDGEKKLTDTKIDQKTPEKPEESDGGWDYYSEKTAIVNGQEVLYSYIKNSYYQTELSFAAGETKVLTVTYKASNSFECYGTSKSLLSSYSDVTFLYDLQPAATWGNGLAGEFNLSIDYNELYLATKLNINVDGFLREPAGVFHYNAKNFDFAKQGFISAIFYYPFELEELMSCNVSCDWLSKVYVSSTLKSKTDAYSAQNLFDGDPDTAWSTNDKGIGQTMELLFEDWAGIGILNGYIKNEELYYDNARIKKLKVERWSVDNTTGTLLYPYEYEVDFEDIPYTDIDKDNLLYNLTLFAMGDDGGGLIRLTVLDVYPGRKYKDICVSEIYLFAQYGYEEDKVEGFKVSPESIFNDYIVDLEASDIDEETFEEDDMSQEEMPSDMEAEEPSAPVVPASDMESPAPGAPINSIPYVDLTVMMFTNAVLAFTLCIAAVIYLAKKKKEHE